MEDKIKIIKRLVDVTNTNERVKAIAKKKYEGNFSLTLRKLIQIGLEVEESERG